LIFINGFSIYYNVRRSVIGIYQSPASLSYARNTNIFPIILRPYTANFDTIINVIGCLIPLDQGVIIEIYRKPILISVFTMYYIGNIP
ncbi:hypothetical protein QBC45DRAFT_326326, partial [Copromyces sp. CBS 386.78]